MRDWPPWSKIENDDGEGTFNDYVDKKGVRWSKNVYFCLRLGSEMSM